MNLYVAFVGLILTASMACKTPSTSEVRGGNVASPVIGTFPGVNQKSIAYQITRAPQPKGSLLFVAGYNQSYLTNQKLIRSIVEEGYSVYALDNRGMGLSERLLPDKPQMGYVEDYRYYVADAQTFLEQFVLPDGAERVGLLGHSTGGRIALDLLANNADVFKAAVLNVPAFQINTGMPPALAQWVAKGAKLLGKGDSWPPGFGPFDANAQFSDNKNTTSPENFQEDLQTRIDHPAMQLGNPSFQWIHQMLKSARDVDRLATQISTPILIIQAGADQFVLNAPQDKFCSIAARCRIVKLDGARHETYTEVAPIKAAMLRSLVSHFNEVLVRNAESTVGNDGRSGYIDDKSVPDRTADQTDSSTDDVDRSAKTDAKGSPARPGVR